ncbi:MAG: oligosaccharide flippase family protein [Clostridia bacterium]|nr:oligosaccharide flippase family protein [Clostridia bacterium]
MMANSRLRNEKKGGGAVILALSAVIVKLLGVLYKVPLTYLLGEVGMGYFNSAYTLYGFFYVFCSAGIAKAVTLLVTEKTDVRSVYRIALRLFLGIGTLITLLFILFSPLLTILIGSKGSLFSIIAIAPSLVFIAISGVMRGYLGGRLRLLPIGISQLIEAVSKLVFGIFFAYLGTRFGFEIKLVCAFSILGITLGSFFSALYLYLYSFSLISNEKRGQNISSKETRNNLLRISMPISLTSSVVSLSSIIDLAVIMRTLSALGYTEADATLLYGNYSTLAVPMINLVVAVLSPLSVASLTRMAEHYSKGESRLLSNELKKCTAICAFLSVPCFFIFGLYSLEVLDILFSSEASTRGAELLAYLSPSAFLLPMLTLFNTAHEAMRDLRTPMISLISGSVVKIVITYVLLMRGYGIAGAPIATVVSYFISILISLIPLIKRGAVPSILDTLVLPMLSASLSYVTLYRLATSRGEGIVSIGRLVSLVALSSVFYAFIYLLLKLFIQKCTHFLTKSTKIKYGKN